MFIIKNLFLLFIVFSITGCSWLEGEGESKPVVNGETCYQDLWYYGYVTNVPPDAPTPWNDEAFKTQVIEANEIYTGYYGEHRSIENLGDSGYLTRYKIVYRIIKGAVKIIGVPDHIDETCIKREE